MNYQHQQRDRKLANSKIVLRNSGTSLLIKIPSAKIKKVLGVMGTLVNLSMMAWLLISLFYWHKSSLFLLMLVLFTVCSLIVSISYIFGKTILKIERENLSIKWILAGSFVFWQRKMLTKNIDKIGRSPVKHGKACTIWQGSKTIKFAYYISEIEQEWLVEEIQSFLNQIRQ